MFAQKIPRKNSLPQKKESFLPRKEKKEQKPLQIPCFSGRIKSNCKLVWNDVKDNHIRSGNNVIQRSVIRFKPEGFRLTEEQQELQDRAEQIDNILQQAYQEFIANDFEDASDGYVITYALRKNHYDEGVQDMHPSTAAGYVIESKVNNRITRAGIKGVSLQNTGLLKGTRPDIVLENDNNKYGLLDITASNNTGHVLLKKGNWTGHKNIIYVAELIYPSIDFKNMRAIELTEEQEAQFSRYANERQNALQEWKDSCENNFLENRKRILDALNNQNIILYPATPRQIETLYSNFGQFGIQLILLYGQKIQGQEIDNFSLDDHALQYYSETSMNDKAQKILNAISSRTVVGMGAV